MLRLPTGVVDDDSSLSFSGLVAMESSFEFTQIRLPSPTPADVLFSNGQILPQHVLTTNYNASTNSSRRSSTTSRSSSTNSSSSAGGLRKCLRDSNGERRSTSKRVSFQVCPDHKVQVHGANRNTSLSAKSSDRVDNMLAAAGRSSNRVARMATAKSPYRFVNTAAAAKRGEKNQGFFGSVLTACRECHALEPSKHVADKIIAV